MSKNSKKVTVMNATKTPESLDVPTNVDNDIQAAKEVIETVPVVEKPKRVVPVRTEAQKKALEEGRKKGREVINARNAKIQAEKEDMQNRLNSQQQQLESLNQQLFEAKIVRKALSVKKKQIKRDSVLDEISDDETPIEDVKKLQSKQPKQPKQPKAPVYDAPAEPKFYFV